MKDNKRVAVITGAANGIGLALTKTCIQNNMHVVMADNAATDLANQIELLRLRAKSELLGVVCDVSSFEDVRVLARQTYDRFDRVDLLINNAGISGHLAPIWEQTNEHVRQVLDINLHGVINGVQVFLPYMFEQSYRSHIVNMASIYGLCSGSHMASYAMSKHAIVALSESLHFDLRRLEKPVDVSVVCPSFANTQLLKNSSPLFPDKLHGMVSDLIERSRPAEEVANHIMQELNKKRFYILPDKEVKDYCEQRTKAILEQNLPYEHNLEKIIASLSRRAKVAN